VSIAALPSRICVLFSEKLNNLLDHLVNRRTMHDSQNDTLKWARRNRNDVHAVAVRRFTGDKYLIHLALITIS
jgi:hypothetical protein